MRKLPLTLVAAVLALTACEGDSPTTMEPVLTLAESAWDEKVTGNGLFNAGKWTDISVSVSATDFDTYAKGNVQYSRTHPDGDLDVHIDVQCLSVSEDVSQVAMAGPLKVQVNTDPLYAGSGTYVDGEWWRYYIQTDLTTGTQKVRFNEVGVGDCSFTSGVATIHTGEYKIRR